MHKKILEYYNINNDKENNTENLPEITGQQGSPLVDISVNKSGNKIASVDGRIHIWDFNSGSKLRSFFTPTRMTSISFIDDNTVVSGNASGMIQVWDVNTGKIKRSFLR